MVTFSRITKISDFFTKIAKKTIIFPLSNFILRDRSIFAPLLTIDLSGRPVGRTRYDPNYLAILGTPKHGGCLIIQFFPNSCAIIPSILMEACRCGRAPSGLSTFKKTMIFEKHAIFAHEQTDASFLLIYTTSN